MKSLFKNVLLITIISLFFHGVWEYFQCTIFYTMENVKNHTYLMLSATTGDIIMAIILYLLLTLINKDSDWFMTRWQLKDYVIMILYSLAFSFYFEANALYTNRWGYSKGMPLLYKTNIGLLPVLQLLILFPLTFFISKIALKYIFKSSSTSKYS